MKKKVVLLLSFILALIISLLLLFLTLFINPTTITTSNKDINRAVKYFSFNLFNKNFFGKINIHNIFNINIIDIGALLVNSPQVLEFNNNQWIILEHKANVTIYSENKATCYQFPVKNGNVISSYISDLNNDNILELLLLYSDKKGKYGDNLIISSVIETSNNISFKTIYKKVFKNMNPWKIQTCDVDGDKKKEISIGMYKTSPFNPIMAKRPFLYEWVGTDIAPKWLGSRLSRPFTDYIFSDINLDGKDELISIEIMENNHKMVNAYTWKGFGFESIGGSDEFQEIYEIKRGNIIKNVGFSIVAKARSQNKILLYKLDYENNRLQTKFKK